MNIDLPDTIILSHLKQCIQMILMTVYATWRNEAHKMQGTMVLLNAFHNGNQSFILEEIAILDVTGDTGQLLIDSAASTDVGMTNFGVAHLTIRQADVFAGCLKLACMEFLNKTIEYRGIRYLYCIVLICFVTKAAAIHNDERNRCIFEFCHYCLLLL